MRRPSSPPAGACALGRTSRCCRRWRALGAELAGSRPLIELGWFSPDRQVGLSGRTVRPAIYVACGVSGQIEHIAGMRSSRTVVAIDANPDAPIHREADYSVVGDLYEIVPALVNAIEETRRASAGGPAATGQSPRGEAPSSN